MSDNQQANAQNNTPSNWGDIQKLFFKSDGNPVDNPTVPPPPNWDIVESLFELNQPPPPPPPPTSPQTAANNASPRVTLNSSAVTQSPLAQPVSPQPQGSQPSATPVSYSFSAPSLLSSTPNSPSAPTNNPLRSFFIPDLATLSTPSNLSQPPTDNPFPVSPLVSQHTSEPLQPKVAPLTTETQQLPSSPPATTKQTRFSRRLSSLANFFKTNWLQTSLVFSLLLPYTVLIPYVISLTERIKQQEQKETQTSNPCSSNMVIYLHPTNAGDSTHNDDSSNVSSFKPLSLTLTQPQLHGTIELAVGSEAKGSKKLSLSLPQAATIVIQPTASQDKTRENTAMP